MFVPRTLRDFGELVLMFTERKVPVRVDSDRQTIDVGALRLHWDTVHPFLHLTQPIHAGVAAERIASVARAIAEYNHEAQLPVLDLDLRTGTISFRVSLPILVDGVRLDLVEALLAGIEARTAELRAQLAPLVS